MYLVCVYNMNLILDAEVQYVGKTYPMWQSYDIYNSELWQTSACAYELLSHFFAMFSSVF